VPDHPGFGVVVTKPYRGSPGRSSTGPNDATPRASIGWPSRAAARKNAIASAIVAAGSRVEKRASRTIRSGDAPITQTNLVPPASMPPSMVGAG
jgi:hypothetical protein